MKRIATLALILLVLHSCGASTAANVSANDPPILGAYKALLIKNIYRRQGNRPDELPTYSLFDFDGDGVAELLIRDVRTSVAAYRDIRVYRYNAVTGKTEHIGTMTEFSGHSEITEDGDGIIIAIRDSERDRITKYTYSFGRLTPCVLLERTDETSEEWYELSQRYGGSATVEVCSTYDMLEREYGKK